MTALRNIKGYSGFEALAAKRGQKLTSIPMKDNSQVKILSNENTFDVYVLRKGAPVNGKMYTGEPAQIQKIATEFFEKIKNKVADGVDIIKEFANATK